MTQQNVDSAKALEFLQKRDKSSRGTEEIKNKDIGNRILGIVETTVTGRIVFAVSKALANPKCDYVDIYHRSKGFNNPTSQQLREQYIYYHQKEPKKYGFKIEYAANKDEDITKELREHLLKYAKETEPDFIVGGMEHGLSAGLFGDSKDVSFRRLLTSTPIVCKEGINLVDQDAPKQWAICIDNSNTSEYAFNVVYDQINPGDIVNLIYPRPQDPNSVAFANDEDSTKYTFKPFEIKLKQKSDKIKVECHILDDPNIGVGLVGFTNSRKRKINFLVVYCDLLNKYMGDGEIMGSISDYCVRHAKAAVIIPRQMK